MGSSQTIGNINTMAQLKGQLVIPKGAQAVDIHTVDGTFVTGSEVGQETITIPYDGSGYPIFVLIMAEQGVPNNEEDYYGMDGNGSGSEGTSSLWAMRKVILNEAPEYQSDEDYLTFADHGAVMAVISPAPPTYYEYDASFYGSAWAYNSAGATPSSPGSFVRFKSATELSYYINNQAYGLAPSTTYRYVIVYSSAEG